MDTFDKLLSCFSVAAQARNRCVNALACSFKLTVAEKKRSHFTRKGQVDRD